MTIAGDPRQGSQSRNPVFKAAEYLADIGGRASVLELSTNLMDSMLVETLRF